MRAMLDLDIPLNAGCLVPLDSKFVGTLKLLTISNVLYS